MIGCLWNKPIFASKYGVQQVQNQGSCDYFVNIEKYCNIYRMSDTAHGHIECIVGRSNFSYLMDRIDAEGVSKSEKIRTKHQEALIFARAVIDDSGRKPVVLQSEDSKDTIGTPSRLLPGVVLDTKSFSDYYRIGENPASVSSIDEYCFAQVIERRKEHFGRRPLPLKMGAVALDDQPYIRNGTVEIRTTVGDESGELLSFVKRDIKADVIPVETINAHNDLEVARMNRFIGVLQEIVSIAPADVDALKLAQKFNPLV